MNQKRDKFLTEAMGECWHEGLEDVEYTADNDNIYAQEVGAYHITCPVCGQNFYGTDYRTAEDFVRTNFSTWEGFGKLWEWATGQKWWKNFRIWIEYDAFEYHHNLPIEHLNPDKFADAIYAYLKEKVK